MNDCMSISMSILQLLYKITRDGSEAIAPLRRKYQKNHDDLGWVRIGRDLMVAWKIFFFNITTYIFTLNCIIVIHKQPRYISSSVTSCTCVGKGYIYSSPWVTFYFKFDVFLLLLDLSHPFLYWDALFAGKYLSVSVTSGGRNRNWSAYPPRLRR